MGTGSKIGSRRMPAFLPWSTAPNAGSVAKFEAGVAVLQDQAKRWLNEQRPRDDVVTSHFVIDEAGMGDPDAAARRLAMLDGIPIPTVNPEQLEGKGDRDICCGRCSNLGRRVSCEHVTLSVAVTGFVLSSHLRGC